MSSEDSKKKAKGTGPIEVSNFVIKEVEYEVEVPKYVERMVEVPVYNEVEYEKPVIHEKEYEKPVITEKDITEGIRQMVYDEVRKGIAEAIQSLKVSFEIPMARILQVQPGGKIKDVGGS